MAKDDDPKKNGFNTWMVLGGIGLGVLLFLAIFLPLTMTGEDKQADPMQIALRVLASVPLIDGHNDLANNLRELANNQLSAIDLNQNLAQHPIWGASDYSHTDIPRLQAGRVGAQFWASYAACSTQYKDSVEQILEQIDVIKRFVAFYPDVFEFVTTAKGIEESFARGKLGSLIGVEGGHGIDNRLSVLRLFYKLGVRYMTLNHLCNTPWSDSSLVDYPGVEPGLGGLSDFGKIVINEMNRLGMMVDLSHTSKQIQIDVITVSTAPVIFSHSNAYQLCDSHRNVHDDVLALLKENNGIVMVNFYQGYLVTSGTATIQDVVDHINHIRRVAGVDHVGIGSDFDGVDIPAEGLEDVSKYPNLIAALAGDTKEPWTEQELRKLVGLNLIRVFKQVEQVRDAMTTATPSEELIPAEDLGNNTECMTPNSLAYTDSC